MNIINDNRTQQQGLCFLSESTQYILNEIIRNVPLLMAISHLQMRQRHMWTDENGGESLVRQLSNLTYQYIRGLAMGVTEEICSLSPYNHQMVVEYLYYKCDALRTDFSLPKFLPIFFRTMFAQCKKIRQPITLRPTNGSNQQVPIKPVATATIAQASSQQKNYQQNYYQSNSSAAQASFVQSAPPMNNISPISQMCSMNNNTHFKGPPQTNTYCARPIWQSNGNNEILTYQPMQANSSQALSAVSAQIQQHQFIQPNTNLNPQVVVCRRQSVKKPCDMQYPNSANQLTTTGQTNWPVGAFSSDSFANTKHNQNTMQAHNALPVLRSVDVAQALQNITQQMIETKAINTLRVHDSKNLNCSSAQGYRNENQNKFVSIHKNIENADRYQSKLNNQRSVQLNTHSNVAKLSMRATSAVAPVPQLTIPPNIDRKRSAPSIRTNGIETAAPPEKMISISLKSATSAKRMQPNAERVSPNTRETPIVDLKENIYEIKNESEPQATISASAILPATINESSTDATKIKLAITDIRLSEPRTIRAFNFDAEEEKFSRKETIYSRGSQFEKSDDFEILVQTSTATKAIATIEKTRISEMPPEECYQRIDLCESSNDNELDDVVVETVDEIVSKPETKVSRFFFGGRF